MSNAKSKLSGWDYRQKRKREEEENKKQSGQLLKFLKIIPPSSVFVDVVDECCPTSLTPKTHDPDIIPPPAAFADSTMVSASFMDIDVDVALQSAHTTNEISESYFASANVNIPVTNVETECDIPSIELNNLNFEDPGNWPELNKHIIQLIVEKGLFKL